MSESTERWLPVVGYEGLYEVSDRGQVKSLERLNLRGRRLRERILKPGSPGKHGHLYVDLYREGHRSHRQVHSVIMETFVGPCPEGMEVRHLNGDSADNCLANLQYGTHRENVADTIRHGNHPMINRTHCPYDHPYDEENTYWFDGRRFCRTCMRKRGKEYRTRQKTGHG